MESISNPVQYVQEFNEVTTVFEFSNNSFCQARKLVQTKYVTLQLHCSLDLLRLSDLSYI